jgi:membrane protein implicated in regulation of membrane protease activity
MALVLAGLIVVALIITYWVAILFAIGSVAAMYLGRRAVESHAGRVDAERRRRAGLRGRAEAQHNWTLQGDERGLYGEYPPTAI